MESDKWQVAVSELILWSNLHLNTRLHTAPKKCLKRKPSGGYDYIAVFFFIFNE